MGKLSGNTWIGDVKVTPEMRNREKAAKKKAELSSTWKERHAKGVPVKMTIEEFYASTMTGYSYPCVRYFNDGYPDARMLDNLQNSYARFCNFRYKPEWLEKKGGQNG